MTDQMITELLASGGDSRLTRDEDGLNRYGCRFEPEPGTLQLGSCTASTVSEVGYEAARRAHRWVTDRHRVVEGDLDEAYADVRRRLAASLVPDAERRPDVVLMPSGTDAEYVPVLLALSDGRRVTNVVTAPTEVGSGSLAAAELRHFDELTPCGEIVTPGAPIDPATTDRIRGVKVPVRDDDHGGPLDPDRVDHLARQTVDAAIRAGDSVLLHVVAHSKTGVHAPSLEYVREAASEHGDRIHVVVDAAQGRISRRGVAEALDAGWIVIVTGSKFFGGPPFSGAVLVPGRYRERVADLPFPPGLGAYFSVWQVPPAWTTWRRAAPSRPDLGVLLRWSAGLAEIEGYYGHDEGLRYRILRAFETAAIDVLSDTPGVELEDASPGILDNAAARLLQSKHTVFSFALLDRDGCRLGTDRLRRVQRAIRVGEHRPDDPYERRPARAQTGQPVTVAPDGRAVLRIALGAPLIRRYSDPVISDTHAVIASDLDFVARWLRQVAA